MQYIKRYKKKLNRIGSLYGCSIDYINFYFKHYKKNCSYEEKILYKALLILNKDLKMLSISKKNITLHDIPAENVVIFQYRKKQKRIIVYTDDNKYKYAVYNAYNCEDVECKTLKECLNSKYQLETKRFFSNHKKIDKIII